jgi:hypothetical protein
MKTVVPISGGLDSAYVLWKLLSETSDEITAVCINTDNVTDSIANRYDLRAFLVSPPTLAIAAVDWLQSNVRPFTFVNHLFDEQYVVRGFGNCNNPQTYIVRYSVPLINASQFDRVVCSGEKENDGYANGGTIETRRPGGMAARDVFVANATRGTIDFTLIADNYTQANALSEMPSDLLAILDTCQPNNGLFKCKKKAWFQNLLDQGKTTQEIYDLWYQSCTTPYQGKWFSMKNWLYGEQPTDQNTWAIPEWPTSYTVP